ncbi:MAG: NADPH-dependent 7-cyano-7-deazaguanine reductase QueF [Gammaproteobacteria bacterium]|jgi:7-cyano-7-deazaguanine reductase|nr:NADPH-dependent 7-cyano-7-deazaguanine reductase QueF [Gammaproteobacteria bacterium]
MPINPMGNETGYPVSFDPSLLVALPRSTNRDLLGLKQQLPFVGKDIWTAYELSWLNNQGLPLVAIARFTFSCSSPSLIESKSFKLFLNSLNQEKFNDKQIVADLLKVHLSKCSGEEVTVELFDLNEAAVPTQSPQVICIDNLDVNINDYHPNSALLHSDENNVIEESLYSDLFKSNCPVTNQPDWGSVNVSYKGPAISREGLLAYLVSYRLHNDYHENCVENIFVDIQEKCKPESLTVKANFLRRGGLDINPIRSTHAENLIAMPRFVRQ